MNNLYHALANNSTKLFKSPSVTTGQSHEWFRKKSAKAKHHSETSVSKVVESSTSYFPIQKLIKISSNMVSTSIIPTICPNALLANLKSSQASSR